MVLRSTKGLAFVVTALTCTVPVCIFAQQNAPTAAEQRAARDFVQTAGVKPLEESGFTAIFNGQSLEGWDCDPDFWRVEGGAMIGETKPNHQPKQNIFCIWKGGEPADFELKAQYRLTGTNGNSGIQYRSIERPDIAKWVMQGYQADIDLHQMFTGQIYEERARGFLAMRGQISYVSTGKKPGSIGQVGEGNQLKSFIKDNDWNDIHIVARGNTLVQLINGHVMSMLIDDDTAGRKTKGEIGIQLHLLPNAAMKMEVKNIRLKNF